MRAFVVDAEWAPRPGTRLSSEEEATRTVAHGGQVWRNPSGTLTDRPDPHPAPGEVVLRVGATGICGTDLNILKLDEAGYTTHDAHSHYPIVTGHEIAGTVVEVGDGVTTLSAGQLVAVESMNWCGVCDACRRGLFNQCLGLKEPGLTYDGGFAEYVAVPAKHCYPLDELLEAGTDADTAVQHGALVEPVGVAFNALFLTAGGFRPGSHAAVFGAGPVGLAAVSLLRAAGAAQVICFETSPQRRDLARQCGADSVIDPVVLSAEGRRGEEIIMDLTKGRGVGVVAECSGATGAVYPIIEGALGLAAKVVQIGIGHGKGQVDLFAYQTKAAQLIGSIGQSGCRDLPRRHLPHRHRPRRCQPDHHPPAVLGPYP